MNNRNKIWVWGLLVLIVINVSALITIGANTWVFKKGRMDRTERQFGRERSPLGGIREKLNLTEAQQGQFENIQETSRRDMRKLFSDMTDYRNKLNGEFSKTQLEMDVIAELNENIVQTDRKIRRQAIDMHVSIRDILTEDQLKIFIEEMGTKKRRTRPPMGFITE